jgi:paraquat-inducible protein B
MTAAKPLVVGSFVLSGLALGIAAILLFGGMHLLRPSVRAVVYFQESVANLNVGAPVTFRGVRVGTVTKIAVHLDMTDLTARIPVYLDLEPEKVFVDNGGSGSTEASFDRLLTAGLRAQLNMQSIVTGQLRVDLDVQPGIAAPILVNDGKRPEIPSVPSRMQTLEGEFGDLPLKDIAENARQALASIQRVADDMPRQIGPLTDSLTQSSDAARLTLGNIDQLVLATTRQLSVNGDQLGRLLVSSDVAVRDSDKLVASLKDMAAPESQIRTDLQSAIRDLAASASSLRNFTHDIERDPSAVLRGRSSR